MIDTCQAAVVEHGLDHVDVLVLEHVARWYNGLPPRVVDESLWMATALPPQLDTLIDDPVLDWADDIEPARDRLLDRGWLTTRECLGTEIDWYPTDAGRYVMDDLFRLDRAYVGDRLRPHTATTGEGTPGLIRPADGLVHRTGVEASRRLLRRDNLVVDVEWYPGDNRAASASWAPALIGDYPDWETWRVTVIDRANAIRDPAGLWAALRESAHRSILVFEDRALLQDWLRRDETPAAIRRYAAGTEISSDDLNAMLVDHRRDEHHRDLPVEFVATIPAVVTADLTTIYRWFDEYLFQLEPTGTAGPSDK